MWNQGQLSPEAELEFYRELHRNIPVVLYRFRLDADGRASVLYISASLTDVSGFSPEEVRSDNNAFIKRLHPDYVDSFVQAIAESAKTMTIFTWEGKGLRANGEEYWVQIISRPHPTADGSIEWDGVITDLTESVRLREIQREAEQQQAIIREQSELLAELSTPLIPISDRVLVMPLIGTLTDRRAQQVMETLLEGIVQYQAETVLLDITGVKTVDTSVANALIQVARAVNLIGSHIVLTGIQPRIAQTLVQLGVSLGDIVTYSTLQAGIASILAAKIAPVSRSSHLAASAL